MTGNLFSPDMLYLIAPALCAGILVALTHVPLGQEVLKRGIIFLDLAVAQIAGLGAIVAATLFEWAGPLAQIPAFVAALMAALVFSKIEHHGQTVQEAFIGCAFVLAASVAILIFSGDPHAGEEVSTLLAGQILWVQWPELFVTAAIYLPVAGIIFFRPEMAQRYFYVLFALSITLSVQLVGVYLVFASLILPALATLYLSGRRALAKGYITAFVSILLGLVVSVVFDLPSGPTLVCSYVFVAAVFFKMKIKNTRRINDLPVL